MYVIADAMAGALAKQLPKNGDAPDLPGASGGKWHAGSPGLVALLLGGCVEVSGAL